MSFVASWASIVVLSIGATWNQASAPPAELQKLGASGPFWSGTQLPPNAPVAASVGLGWSPRAVTMTWRYGGSEHVHMAPTKLPTAYWPTAAAPLTGRRLLVAGKDRNGATRIELWTFGSEQYAQSSGGALAVVPPALQEVELLYGADVEGRRLVRNIVPMRTDGGTRALVQFHDSGDVHVLDWSGAPTLTLVAAASGALADLVNVDRDYAFGGLHMTFGAVYVFANSEQVALDPIVFVDSDVDGTIDWYTALDEPTYAALGFKNRQLYHEVDYRSTGY